ncbi:MAG TPA: bifunctional diaminohydroxyphosphoribosylaminopyrimidine deaminase/5-amino-6-(5-phosphoribosylamino)uracil reductase RibD [Terriglobia bacterium]|nr:bifunctional diaminohydroxyphosphoribosylaminopyrimidine deaminase/5-amino-6-(5-phosphoribosylamino)uracil reductase RibD [Terriglobia bacterium]
MPARDVSSDEHYMHQALRLARQSSMLPYPNPWVGCAIVRDGKVVGRGFHRGAGTSHAEVEALAQAGQRARGATLYVNLEPCCHHGRTPPCTDAILKAEINRVVYALRDPNPEVNGCGARILRQGGVRVSGGVCAAEAAALNEVYLKFRATGLPFVTAKIAATLDGKIATRSGEAKWITDAAARRHARILRGQHQAVAVGINTVLADDPHLGPRSSSANDPWRVVLDSTLRTPLRARVVKSGRCIVACTRAADPRKREALLRAGAQVWSFPGARVPVRSLLRRLAAEGVLSLLVEGGGEMLGSFLDQNLVDRFYWYLAPAILGSVKSRPAIAGRGAARLSQARRLTNVSIQAVGNAWLIRGNLSRWALSDLGQRKHPHDPSK